jgi:hypothetical protein
MTTVVDRFLDLFKGFERAHGKYVLSGGVHAEKLKAEGKAYTSRGPLRNLDIEEHLSGGKYGVGAVPLQEENTVSFAAIDIDSYSNFDLVALEQKIKENNLPLVLCRSKSGGAHLYLFTVEPISATLAVAKMSEFSAILGYGGVEIFPKQVTRVVDGPREDLGNWINLPYFNAKDTQRYALKDGQPLNLEEFLAYAESKKVTHEQLNASGANLDQIEDWFKDGPPCLKYLALKGGFPEGTRNDGMYNAGVYLKLRFGDSWKDELLKYNGRMCDPELSLDEINTLAGSLARREYNYTCRKSPICNHCDRKACTKEKYGVKAAAGDKEAELIEISSITKYLGTPVLWRVELEGVAVMVETEQLMQQSKFNMLCMERINRIPGTVSRSKWERYLDEKIKSADIVAPPEDASAEGQFMGLLESFCHGTLQARNQDEIVAGKPWRDNNKVYFKSRSLIEYLENHKFKIKSEHHLWHMVKHQGAEPIQMRIKGKNERVWMIEDFDAPETEKKEIDFGKEVF